MNTGTAGHWIVASAPWGVVTAGGVVAGIIGPSIARATYDKWVPIYSATYAAMIGIHVTDKDLGGYWEDQGYNWFSGL